MKTDHFDQNSKATKNFHPRLLKKRTPTPSPLRYPALSGKAAGHGSKKIVKPGGDHFADFFAVFILVSMVCGLMGLSFMALLGSGLILCG
jgi:hypothetical protein